MADIAAIVDLERWPIADLSTPAAQAVVAEARAKLENPGYFTMPGFVRSEAVAAMVADARPLLAEGHWHERMRDVTIGEATHNYPWHRPTRASVTCAGGDRMGARSPLRMVYEWQPLTDFLGAVFGKASYHRSGDEMVGCMLTAYAPGDELGWHFDPNDGVVTLLLQKAGRGGVFEFAPAVRRDDPAETVAACDAIMDGTWPELRREDQEPGTLALFNGHRALHRVTPTEAGPDRIMLVLSYDSQPGQRFSDDIRRNFFGRVA